MKLCNHVKRLIAIKKVSVISGWSKQCIRKCIDRNFQLKEIHCARRSAVSSSHQHVLNSSTRQK